MERGDMVRCPRCGAKAEYIDEHTYYCVMCHIDTILGRR